VKIPTTLAGARTQNERWELGRLQLAKRFVPELARRTLRGGGAGRIASADALLDQLVPPLSVLGAATGVVAIVTTAATVAARRPRSIAGALLAWFAAGALGFHVLAGLRLANAPRAIYAALLRAPRFVLWKVALWLRMVVRPTGVAWQRTERNVPDGGPTPGAVAGVSSAAAQG